MGYGYRYTVLLCLCMVMWSWRPARPASDPSSIAIGLFIPTRGKQASEGLAVRRGAEMAVDRINAEGGIGGRSVRLAIGSADERWEAGADELVRLIYQEDVWAVVGAVDGLSAHLAAQVVTRAKGRVVFITPWATDPTLTRSNIPWFFRMAPDDRQQADVLAQEIFERRHLRRIVVLAEDRYDARMASEAFVKAANRTVELLRYDTLKEDRSSLRERFRRSHPEGWVLFGSPSATADLVRYLHEAGNVQPLFGALNLACPAFLESADSISDGVILVGPGGNQGDEGRQFRQAFENTYGHAPYPLVSYAYDSLTALARAIRQAGSNRASIRDALIRVRFTGLTGPVAFDDQGNRRGPVEAVRVRRGRLVPETARP